MNTGWYIFSNLQMKYPGSYVCIQIFQTSRKASLESKERSGEDLETMNISMTSAAKATRITKSFLWTIILLIVLVQLDGWTSGEFAPQLQLSVPIPQS
jgi:hypothetical protein